MKKLTIISLLIFLTASFVFSQVAINNDGSSPEGSSMLDIKSKNKGLLPPRMTQAELNAIPNPAEGLIVYCTNCGLNGLGALSLFKAGVWQTIGNEAGDNPGDMQFWNGTEWVMIPVGRPGQFLQLSALNIPTWSGVSYPSIITKALSTITNFSALCGGDITNDGGVTVTTRGVCWSTATAPTIALTTKTIDGSGIGNYTSAITGLTASTTYYVRAYATNSVGTSYGNELSFSTTNSIVTPTLTTITPATITATTAISGGSITNDGGADVTARGVCWSTTQNPTITNTKVSCGSGVGSFVSNITGLSAATTYYIRAYATNKVGTSYGSQKSFITQDGVITILTNNITSVTSTSASTGGKLPMMEVRPFWHGVFVGVQV